MKICIISVAPMPSRIFRPVAFCHASNVAFGSASPAETHLRSEEMSCSASLPSIARYAVGAVKQIVALYLAIAGSSTSGGADSSWIEAAPMRNGNSTCPPSPNVKARGGEPMKRSSRFGCSTYFE